MITPRRTRTEFAMNARVSRAAYRRRLVLIASTDDATAPIPRHHSTAEVFALQRRRRRTHLALQHARTFAVLVLVLFYLVPIGAALDWWGA